MGEPELILMKDAMEWLGVSKHTIARIVKDYKIPVYLNPLDKRERRVAREDIERIVNLRETVGKAIAAA